MNTVDVFVVYAIKEDPSKVPGVETEACLFVSKSTWLKRHELVVWCLVNHHLQNEEYTASLSWLNWILQNRNNESKVAHSDSFHNPALPGIVLTDANTTK